MKDLLIGAADNYSWATLAPWANSIRKSGFGGDIALLLYRTDDKETITSKCKELNIDVYECDSDSYAKPIVHAQRNRDTQIHQMRFFHAWQFLSRTDPKYYRHIIMTDTKDVIFQRNPSEWLEWLDANNGGIIAPSEGIKYKNEPWGKDNLMAGYGPYVYNTLQEEIICNVGTIAGDYRSFTDLCLLIYTMGENRYIPNDQSTFNVLVQSGITPKVQCVAMSTGWACQCGTTLDPAKNFDSVLEEPKPIIKDGLVYTAEDKLFYIVHQWDRIPQLKTEIEQRYQ